MLKLFKYLLLLLIWGGIFFILILAYYYHDLPDISNLESLNSQQKIYINYSNGSNIVTLGDVYRNQVAYNQIPKNLINAVIATEDRRFFTHKGIDIIGIMRAAYVNYKSNRIVQGGSTITQQLVKLTFLTPKKTFKRKIQEILLALKIETIFSKEQIMAFYLNKAYFGSGNYGIANAARNYFNKLVEDLSLYESAMLAGLLKAPSRLNPNNNKKLAEDGANQVISNMINAGYIKINDIPITSNKLINYSLNTSQRFYFTDYIISSFKDYISSSIDKDSLVINTTLDKRVQNIVENELGSLSKKYKKNLSSSQVAVLVMAKDGAILAMIGGKDYRLSQFNRALYAKRQSGSAFKTIIYLTALQKRL